MQLDAEIGLFVVLLIALTMTTDNPLLYSFFVAPAGVLIGMGVRRPSESPPGEAR